MLRSSFFLLFLGLSQTASATYLINGSFEQPLVSGFGFFTSVPGWNAVGPNSFEIQNGVNSTAYDGAQVLELDGNGNSHIQQIVQGLTFNGDYTLSLAYSARPGNPATTTPVEVLWNNVVIATLVADGTGLSNYSWQLFSFRVTAVTGDNTVGLRGAGLSDNGGGIVDAVSLSDVPEPGTFALAGVAVLALGYRRLRNRA